MSQVRRAESSKRAIWDGYDAGAPLKEIAGGLGCAVSTVWREVAGRGGFRPRVRHRAARHLTLEEREQISRGLAQGLAFTCIAAQLGRATSTISREVGGNGGRERYRAVVADAAAWRRGQRPKRCKLAFSGRLRSVVAHKLCLRWSPEQIAAYLKQRYPDEPSMQVSHETIYQSLFIQARGALKKELVAHLRSARPYRRRKRAQLPERQAMGPIADAISIRERPAEVADRAVPGHWEGDLIIGSDCSAIATLVERHSRFVMLVRIPDRSAATVAQALERKMHELPQELRRSLTWDRGSELADHRKFSLATDMKVYFCDPHSPWQRGSNENTNGLLRQYYPKGTDLSQYTQRQLNAVARELNGRPRKTLGWANPAETLAKALH